jgi:hypothetical protein
MKVLIDPIYTSRWQSKCSTYYALKNAALDLLKDEDTFVYCTVPDTEFNPQFINDDLIVHDRCLNIPVKFGRDRYQNMFFPSDDLMKFSNSGEYWDWDVLITTRNNGWFWRLMSRKNNEQRYKKLLILVEPFPMMTFKSTVAWHESTDLMILNSYLAFDYVFIQTQWEKYKILETAKRYMSPSQQAKLISKFMVTFPKPDLDYNFPLSGVKKDGKGLIYVQRIDESERRVSKMLEVFRKSFILSKELNVSLSTNSAGIGDYEDVGFMEFHQLPRSEFYDLLKKQSICVSWSKDEGMPFSLLEANAFGVIPIVKRELWSKDFYGDYYWGLVDSLDEAVSKVRYVIENYDQAYQDFMVWYKNWLGRYIANFGDQSSVQQSVIGMHFESLVIDSNRNKQMIAEGKDYLSELIDKSGDLIFDFNNEEQLTGLEGVRTKKRTIIPIDVPLSRQRDMYPDRMRLLLINNWKDTLSAGVMRKA